MIIKIPNVSRNDYGRIFDILATAGLIGAGSYDGNTRIATYDAYAYKCQLPSILHPFIVNDEDMNKQLAKLPYFRALKPEAPAK